MIGCAIRWAVEARSKGRSVEKEQSEETRTESTDEPEVTDRFAEV